MKWYAYSFKHFPDLVEEYLKQNNLLEIKDPVVWDEIAVRLVKTLGHNRKYIIEFARGHDPNYLKKFDIPPEDVYSRTIGLMVNSMHLNFANSMAIIHITCNYESRLFRNSERRNTTGQNLPDSVLKKVFEKDIFRPEYIDDEGHTIRRGFFNKSVPVIDNTFNVESSLRCKHFKLLSTQTMDCLTKRTGNNDFWLSPVS